MEKTKHPCGQCEFYLHKPNKCPHPEKTAYDDGCKLFEYTNPTLRIDGLTQRNAELEKFLKESIALAKDYGLLAHWSGLCKRIATAEARKAGEENAKEK